jgi:hypothetical protein
MRPDHGRARRKHVDHWTGLRPDNPRHSTHRADELDYPFGTERCRYGAASGGTRRIHTLARCAASRGGGRNSR